MGVDRTSRNLVVADMIVRRGCTIRDVAKHFHVAPSTVMGYLSQIRRSGVSLPRQPPRRVVRVHKVEDYATCRELGIAWTSVYVDMGHRMVLLSLPATPHRTARV